MTQLLDLSMPEGSPSSRPTMTGILAGDPLSCDAEGRVHGVGRRDYVDHVAVWGHRSEWFGSRGDLLRSWVAQIDLTGRGGAHFPVARKWEPAVAAGPGGTVVVNAAEGEPAAAKDAALVQVQPHLVLDGAAAIAEMIGAREIVIWMHADNAAMRESVEAACAERTRFGVSGPPVRVVTAPHAYVSGESSAVIQGVRGGPALPTMVVDPARPWGDGPAVLVHNAETVARVGALAATGPSDYRASSLVTVATTAGGAADGAADGGRITRRTVIEARPDESVMDIVARVGATPPAAVLLGGFGGTWLDWHEARDLPLDPLALRSRGLSLGAGVILLAPTQEAVSRIAAAIAGYLADESARQCGPCVFGLPALAKAAERGSAKHLRSLLPLVEGRGACRHPDGAVRMLRTSLELTDHWHAERARTGDTRSRRRGRFDRV